MYISIILLPLIILIIICLFSRYIGIKGVYWLIIIMMLELLWISIIINYEILIKGNIISLNIFNNFELINLKWILIYDNITSIMLFMIISISIIVIIYSYDYMINEPHIIRFYLYIILFIWNMIILVTTNNNIILLFIGWEGVGISSYLLITYWFTRIETNWGGLLAIFMNRIGDIFFILAILISYLINNTTDILIFNINLFNDFFILIFFLAAMAKSAQLYLHLWLPFSMEGPTPISALIHAATMVTAGVYILIRINLIISYSYYSILFIIFIGSLTTFIGSLLALTSIDMKELIAYSTMSQLGYMVTCIGLNLTHLSFIHLIFHAYFKALLFLTIGSILHTILDIQDIRFTGSLISLIPLSYIFLLYGILSLIGLPFTTGYYSKESLIFMSYNNLFHDSLSLLLNQYVFIITLLTAIITIIYNYKFIYQLFFSISKLSLFIFKHIHLYSLHLIFALSLLSFFTLILGFFTFKWHLFIDLNIPFLNHNISFIIKLIPLIAFIFNYYLLTFLFNKSFHISIISLNFGFKYLYIFISSYILYLSYRILYKIFDYGYLDLLFPKSGIILYNLSINISNIFIKKYILPIILNFIFIIIYII